MQPATAYVYHGGGSGRKTFSSNIQPLQKDIKVKISGTDTTTDYLENKLEAGTNIQLIKLNAGGNEKLKIVNTFVPAPDIFVKINSSDSTADYLFNKIVAGSNISLNVIDVSGNKKIEIVNTLTPSLDIKVKCSGNDTTTDYLINKLQAGSNISLTTINPNANEKIQINANFGLKQKFSISFCQTDTIAVGSLCPAPNGASNPSFSNGAYICATHGYLMPFKVKILSMQASTPKYKGLNVTTSPLLRGHLRFQIKTTPMNVFRSTDTTMETGLNLINLDLLVPDTSSLYGYNFGMNFDLIANNLVAQQNDMIFIAHCNISSGCTFYGSHCVLHLEEF